MRIAVAGLLVATLAGTAGANGRDPYISSITFRPDAEQQIMAGATFGLLSSTDGGATWQWYCENAVGYGGTYDPDYAFSASGALFATTFDGLKVMRDGCTFAATPPGMTFVSRVERGPDGAIYFAASDPNDTKIYKSTDDGASFPVSATPGMAEDWWQSIVVAPSNASRVYLSGYRLPKKCTSNSSNPGTACATSDDCPGGMCEPQKELLLFKSIDGGASFTAMSMTEITPTSQNSAIDIVGVHPTLPDVVFARVTLENATSGESIYKSTNGGANWTKILTKDSNIGNISFLVRRDGSCVAGTRDLGAWQSAGCDTTWTDLVGAPHIGCLAENSANEVWACTQNTASPQLGLTSDGYGIMKSNADLTAWTGVLRFSDIQAPVACAAGTIQEDECVQGEMGTRSPWCCFVSQVGITGEPIDCSGPLACFAMPAEPPPPPPPPPPGCCGTSSRPPISLTLLVAAALLFRRRRPKEP